MPASKFGFHPAAEAELQEAADWYEAQREGLGLEFLESVRQRISVILENPKRWRSFQGTRRVLLGRFPYALVYREVARHPDADGREVTLRLASRWLDAELMKRAFGWGVHSAGF